jgi:hypothetical protein
MGNLGLLEDTPPFISILGSSSLSSIFFTVDIKRAFTHSLMITYEVEEAF